jgi:membrane protease YdiL (CAAX protease family)
MLDVHYILKFSIKSHLPDIIRSTLPLLMLVRVLALRENFPKRRSERANPLSAAAGIILSGAGLFTIALFFSALASLAGEGTAPLAERPENYAEFAVMLISCLGTAYLEEGFFRFYFLEKLNALGRSAGFSVAVSAFGFAVLHLWEGRWGVLNAFTAAIFLSFIYLKTRKLHIPALAHFIYNTVVYML